jgi:hypothetical protein
MKNYPMIRASWYAANILLAVSLALVVFSIGWEFSMRSYLKGFSDAIIPYSDTPEQKVAAILTWMQHGPERRGMTDPETLDARNPEDTLNYHQLLEVCGTATNAFVNLAQSSGLHARRLLLLGEDGRGKHVVVEVLLDNLWIVVDPAFHTILRAPNGRFVTRAELLDSETFRAVTHGIPGYPSTYTYERTAHIRLSRIPFFGRYLRRVLTFIWPSWEESINWTLLLERESFAVMTLSILLFCFALTVRLFLSWYCSRMLGIVRPRLRDQLVKVGDVLFSGSK